MKLDEMESYRALIRENIEYDLLLQDHPYEEDTLEGYLELMVEVCCSRREFIRISGEEVPTGVVKSRFLKLNREHIDYVLSCMNANVCTTRSGLAMTACKLWDSMKNGESVVLTRWGAQRGGGTA